jgi:hypothetical protein
MAIIEFSHSDEPILEKFHALARQVYANDPMWVPQSEPSLSALFSSDASRWAQPLLLLQDDAPMARAVAILNSGAFNDQDQPVGYIGYFECLKQHPQAGIAVLAAAEQLLRQQGATTVQAPRVDNMLMGLVMDRFDLPQTILTTHNPPYYADILLAGGYHIREKLYTYIFDRNLTIPFPLSLAGFRTRTFNRNNLEAEILIFHHLQQEIFSQHPGWVPRTLEEDRHMILSFLPMLDDELVIIAEENNGRAVGLLVCLPDVYQAFRGQAIDNARAITIGVIEPLVQKGLGVLMGTHLARNLMEKGYRTMEASWIRDSNIQPQNMVTRRFRGRRGREFALFEKML